MRLPVRNQEQVSDFQQQDDNVGDFNIKFLTVRHLGDVVPCPQIPLLLSSCLVFSHKGTFCHQSGSCRSNVLGFSSWQNLMSLTLWAAGWGSCLSRGAVASLTSDHTDCWLEPACECRHTRNALSIWVLSLAYLWRKDTLMVSALIVGRVCCYTLQYL